MPCSLPLRGYEGSVWGQFGSSLCQGCEHLISTPTAVSLRSSPLPGVDPSAVYRQPRSLHEEEEGRLVGGPADESAGEGGESQEAGERHLVQPGREPASEMQMNSGRNSLQRDIKHMEQL